jgi:hypothetical protein
MNLSPDQIIYWQMGFFKLNATIVFTWLVMSVLVVASILITRKLTINLQRSRWQNLLEVVVINISKQIEEVGLSQPNKYLGFLGSLFLFIALSALGTVVRSLPRLLWLCVCWWQYRYLVFKSKGWVVTFLLMPSQPSLCCHLILSVRCREPWRSRCDCLAI